MAKVKLSKNPENFLHDYFIEDYIDGLMENDNLDKLPDLVLDYFILKLLYDEVTEGGFEQFVYNHYEYVSKHLFTVFNRVEHDKLKNILDEYLSVLSKTNVVDRNIEDKSLIKLFNEIDDKFAELDHKENILKIIKSEYKIKYGDKTFYLEIDKPKETSNLRFFNWTKKGCTIDDVVESIKNIIRYFDKNDFNIIVKNFFGFLHITISSDKLLPMDNLINDWHINNKNNVCYFENFSISNTNEDDKDIIRIFKSGLDKNEYFIEKVKHSKTKLDEYINVSKISLSNNNKESKKEEIQLFYLKLNEAKNELKNIKSVELDGSSSNIKDITNSLSKLIFNANSIDEINKEEVLKIFNDFKI